MWRAHWGVSPPNRESELNLVTCSSCAELVASSACVCPHCSTQLRVCSTGSSTVVRAAGAALLGLSAAGCFVAPQPEYGVPIAIEDVDGDGYDTLEDCDDNDETVYPDAPETPGDEIDSNCDGNDDT